MRYLNSVIAIVLSFFLFHQAFALSLNPDLKEIVADGKLTVAFVPSFATPYVYYDANGQLQGFDVELAQYIADALEVKLDPIIASSYNEAIVWVANHKAEMAISNITRTIDRAKYVLFSRPYNSVPLLAIESRHNATTLNMTRDQVIQKYNKAEYVVGVIDGTMFTDLVQTYFPKTKVVVYTDPKQMLADVSNKKINVALTDGINGKTFFKDNPEIALLSTTTLVNDWMLSDSIVMDMKHMGLKQWLDIVIISLEQNGRLKELREKYFSNLAR